MRHTTPIAAFLLLVSATAANAQDIGPALNMNLMTSWTGGAAVQADLEKRAREAKSGTANHTAIRGSHSAASRTFTYAPSAAIKKKAVDNLVARLSKQDPKAARSVAQELAKHDYDGIYRSILSGTGLHNNDAADAFTTYMVLGWMIANGVQKDPPPASMRAARNQVAAILTRNPGLSTPSVRAQLGEEMKLMIVMIHAGWQSAQRSGTGKAYADNIAAMYAQSGSDLRGLKLTSKGFTKA